MIWEGIVIFVLSNKMSRDGIFSGANINKHSFDQTFRIEFRKKDSAGKRNCSCLLQRGFITRKMMAFRL